MALIAPGVCRFVVNGIADDRPFANILDFEIDTTGTGIDRSQAIYDCAGNIINSWVEHILPLVSPNHVLQSVSWVDLDAPDGSTGERTTTSEHTLPAAGTQTGAVSGNQVAVLVTKRVPRGRSQRNGRMYIYGIPEDHTAGPDIQPTIIPSWQTALSNFLTELNDETPTINVRTLTVVHTTAAAPDVGTHTNVESLDLETRLATQRRRQRG